MRRDIPAEALPLCFQIRDWHTDITHFASFLEYLCLHMKDGFLVPALKWLVDNRLTGERFIQFTKNECKGSQLELYRYLVMRVKKESKLSNIHAKEMNL
jgi:hypothetical protein